MLLTLGGMLVSIVSAAIIVRQKLLTVVEQVKDVETRLRKVDIRVDKGEIRQSTAHQSLEIISGMLSPDRREKYHRETATILARLENIETEISHLKALHNGKHRPVHE